MSFAVSSPEKFAPSPAAPHDGLLESPRIHVLVADDNETNRQVVTAQLRMLGITAEVAKDGGAALACWRRGGFHLLLTDLQMPVMDGFTLAASVRAEEQLPARTPIVALTANASHGEAARCAAAGMDDCLTKPVKLPVLEAMLRRLLGKAPRSTAPAPLAMEAPPQRVQRPPSDGQPIAAGVLAGVFGDDPARLNALYQEFAADAAATANALASAVRDGRPGAAGVIAHRLKAAARSVGARRLGNLCAHIESADAAGDDVGLAASVILFKDEATAVGRWIDAHDAISSSERELP